MPLDTPTGWMTRSGRGMMAKLQCSPLAENLHNTEILSLPSVFTLHQTVEFLQNEVSFLYPSHFLRSFEVCFFSCLLVCYCHNNILSVHCHSKVKLQIQLRENSCNAKRREEVLFFIQCRSTTSGLVTNSIIFC